MENKEKAGRLENTENVYRIELQYVFNGYYKITAENAERASEIAKQHCGTVLGEISTTWDEDKVDWSFDKHPDVVTKYVRHIG